LTIYIALQISSLLQLEPSKTPKTTPNIKYPENLYTFMVKEMEPLLKNCYSCC